MTGPLWTLVTILGPILLLAVIVYAWLRNRNAPPGSEERADRGAKELREDIEREPNKPVDL